MEINVFRFGWCKREVWENFLRRERHAPRSRVMMLSLEFGSLARRFPTFAFGAVLAEIPDCLHEN